MAVGQNHNIAGGKRWVRIAALASVAIVAPAVAHAAGQIMAFNIAAGPLDRALADYAAVTHRQLLFQSSLVAGLHTKGVSGQLDADTALQHLLAGTGIEVKRAGNAFVLMRNAAAATPAAAQVTPPPPRRRRERPRTAQPAQAQLPEEAGQQIVVTGSNIRGISETSSQVITLGREEIDRAGQGSVAEAIQALPQNFGGTGTEDTSITSADRTTANDGLGSSANLRGLGSDATLTLVNGRRVAGSGGQGDFTDLSSIPLAAVERVEVLTDGASALYGSDAVGGVVNVILRKSLDGGETRIRMATTTDGGATEIQLGQVLGKTWSSGHILGAYEYSYRERLRADQRDFTRNADLRQFGGSDWRSYFSNPGTILGFDATGALVPLYAIPSGQDGTALTQAQLIPGQNSENFRAGTDLLPRQERHSAWLTGEQEILPGVKLFAEARYAHRAFDFHGIASQVIAQVLPNNPYFVSVNGAPYTLVAYSMQRELGPVDQYGTVETWSGTGGIDARLFGDWAAEAYVTHAVESTDTDARNYVNVAFLNEALGTTPDDPSTSFSTARDGYFNPFGDGRVNSQAVLDFVDQGWSTIRVQSRVTSANLKTDGSLFALPGGKARAAFGANYRGEAFERGGEALDYLPTVRHLNRTDASRDIAALFGEIMVPLFGEANARPGFRQLQLSAAVRYEHYSDFGSTTNPKFGVIWEPVSGLSFRASYGTSFRAPVLREIRDPLSVSYVQLKDASGNLIPVITMFGGNPGLQPETANTFTANVRFVPPGAKRWRFEATWFQTDFRNRIERPAADNLAAALSNPIFSPYVARVDPANNAADRARVLALINANGSLIPPVFPPEFFRAILDGRLVNSARLQVRGIDLLASGSFALAGGEASISANASHMIDYERQVTPLAPLVEDVGTINNPPTWRARGSVGWDSKHWGISTAVNFVSGYTDDVSVPSRPVGSWTTFDLQLRMQPAPFMRAGLSIALNVQNLFDADPPFVDQLSGVGYGAANADPLGRLISLQLVKRW